MMSFSARDISKCSSERVVRPACPRRVPEAREEKGFGHRALVNEIGAGRNEYYVFSVEWGAPYENKLNPRDRPPRFSHLVVHAGDVTESWGFGWPGEKAPAEGQRAPQRLGERQWGRLKGSLLLAPPYPHGGVDGSHLMFLWREGSRDFVVSMHAWEPLEETERYLEETVRSIP